MDFRLILTLLLTSIFLLYVTNEDKIINVLSRLVNYMSFDKRPMVMKAFTESQFNYFPLIWLFHSRTLNNKINLLHERALRIVYSDYKASFCELLEKDKSFSIRHRNIQSLASLYIINLFASWITSLKSIKLSLMILENEKCTSYFKLEITIL